MKKNNYSKPKAIKLLVSLIFFSFIFLQSCSDNSNKFLGTWQSKTHNDEIFIITKSGKNFIIEAQHLGELGDKTFPGIYDKDKDVLSVHLSGATFDIVVNQNTNELLFNTEEFEKQ